MSPPCRLLLPLFFYSLLPPGPCPAAVADERELDVALEALPAWTWSAAASVAAGYNDNVLLGTTATQASALVRTELEFMALRVPAQGWDGHAYLNLVESRYLGAGSADHERTVLFSALARWSASEAWQLSLATRAYHQDQVFDVSTTEAQVNTALLRLTGYQAGPTLRWSARHGWIEVGGAYRDDRYHNAIDGYDEREAQARAGLAPWHGFALIAEVAHRRRDHDTRPQFTLGGRPIAGSVLAAGQREAGLRVARTWAGGRLRTELAAQRREHRDNGTGYFDFNRREATASATWRQDRWEVRGQTAFARYIFPSQFVGFGLEPELRRKDEIRGTLEIAWRWTDALSVLVAGEAEQSRSNDERSRFRVHRGYSGVRWDWDSLARHLVK